LGDVDSHQDFDDDDDIAKIGQAVDHNG